MTDEEFYKNLLIEIFNEHFGKKFFDNKDLFMPTHWANKLEYLWKERELINIKRKLIIKEKTWYKARNGHYYYVYAILPSIFNLSEPVQMIDRYGTLSSRVERAVTCEMANFTGDLIAECTPEEVKEIEDKLMEKKNDNE